MAAIHKHHHAVQFYSDEQSLAQTVARFIADGLECGEPGIVIATQIHAAMIKSYLEATGLSVSNLQRTTELTILDARKMLASFMVSGAPDPLLFKSQIGAVIDRLSAGRPPSPVRAYGEMVDVLWQDGWPDAAIKLEMLWNRLASDYAFALMCGYQVSHFSNESSIARFQRVCQLHTDVELA